MPGQTRVPIYKLTGEWIQMLADEALKGQSQRKQLYIKMVAGAGFRLRRDAAQLLLPLIATHASLRLRVNLLPRRFKSAALCK